jgi:hypothetical protein
VPIRGTKEHSLQRIADAGFEPQVIFFDSIEERREFQTMLLIASDSFPKSVIIGHRMDRKEVREVLEWTAEQKKLRLESMGSVWRISPR